MRPTSISVATRGATRSVPEASEGYFNSIARSGMDQNGTALPASLPRETQPQGRAHVGRLTSLVTFL